MSIQDKVLLRKIKKREKKKFQLIQSKQLDLNNEGINIKQFYKL